MTVQKNLKQLKGDCERIQERVGEVFAKDKARRAMNTQRTMQGMLLSLLALAAAAFLGMLVVAYFSHTL